MHVIYVRFRHFSIASSWGIYLLHYLVFSLVGVYLDNVVPNSLGAVNY
jgi:peptidoglycan/LPS O-acetylase OafA/YrhL